MNTVTLSRAAQSIARSLQQGLPTRRALATGMAGTAAALCIGVAHGATLTVSNLADSGAGSLRNAISAANASRGIADTIIFGVSGTITLASRLPDIDDDVTIDGKGQTITIDGNNAVQVLYVGAGKTLKLAGVSIVNGRCDSPCSGGAILNVGTLEVSKSKFSGNSALLGGAIHNFGMLKVTGSTFSGNSARFGGAIHNFYALTVTDSRFLGNSAMNTGGAIYNFDTMTISGSTFSGNSAKVASDNIASADRGTMKVTKSNIVCNTVACSNSGDTFVGNSGLTAQR
jgi:Chlamydia polymorphic membrane protein (Chlamydia_PMP) repeat